MKRIFIGILICTLLINFIPSIQTISSNCSYPTIIYVDNDNLNGPWNGTWEHPYQYIREAINNSDNGDTILVANGRYYENIIINKSLTIECLEEDIYGHSKMNAVIFGTKNTHVLQITADNVTISKFILQNGNGPLGTSAIYITSNNVIISENNFSYNMYGVRTEGSSNVDIIKNNFTRSYWRAIKLTSSQYTNISDNKISGCYKESIWIEEKCNYTIISNNTLVDNNRGISIHNCPFASITENTIMNSSFAISLDSDNSSIIDNFIINCAGDGIKLKKSNNVTISGNYITNSHHGGIFDSGIQTDVSSNVTIVGNVICDNKKYGIISQTDKDFTIKGNFIIDNDYCGIWTRYGSKRINISENFFSYNEYPIRLDSSGNTVCHNNFINNDFKSEDYGNSIWDHGYPSGGNYWGEVYSGSDNFHGPNQDLPGSDGIGDTPCTFLKEGIDNYPLMERNGWFNEPPTMPTIEGKVSGVEGRKYAYTFTATDPESYPVYYYIDWGDSTYDEWIGPYISGEPVIVRHKWPEKGNYSIRAKAKDTRGVESDWGTLEITTSKADLMVSSSFFLNAFVQQNCQWKII